MKNLLYIGNKLSGHGFSVTSIETLGPLLESEGYDLVYASSKKNKMARLLDMLSATVRLRNMADFGKQIGAGAIGGLIDNLIERRRNR